MDDLSGLKQIDAELDAELSWMVRATAKRVTGGNCTFADADLRILAELARRAVEAGLTEGLHPTVLRNIARLPSPPMDKEIG